MPRLDHPREIERLDPERDCERIVHLPFGFEFCWDTVRALELALYRSYCVPSISAMLDRTTEFHQATQRRYDDTAILIAEMCEWGYEEGRGKAALDRMNWAHAHYRIANDDYLYVPSTLVFEPIRWVDAFGWRRSCHNERLGFYHFWRSVAAAPAPATFLQRRSQSHPTDRIPDRRVGATAADRGEQRRCDVRPDPSSTRDET